MEGETPPFFSMKEVKIMKIKVIAIITVIMILLISVPVYAEMPIPDPPYGAYNYFVVAHAKTGEIYLITTINPTEAPKKGSQIYTNGGYKIYCLLDGYWSYENEGLNGSVPIEHVYAANHDIAYSDGSGFFFTLPKVSELYQAVSQVKNKGTFGMILRDFSAGLIPVLGCLILAISFRKGWAFLQGQLMH